MLTLLLIALASVFLLLKISSKYLKIELLKTSQIFLKRNILYVYIFNFFIVSVRTIKGCSEINKLQLENGAKTSQITRLQDDSENKEKKIELLKKEELIIREIYFKVEMLLKAKTRVGRSETGMPIGRTKGIVLIPFGQNLTDSTPKEFCFYRDKVFGSALDSVTLTKIRRSYAKAFYFSISDCRCQYINQRKVAR